MAQSGQKIWLSGGVGELRIYLGVPPREAKGKRIPSLRFADELRSWIADGVGANHAVWFEIYDWLGRALPQPPAPRDIVRMADELVEAFEQGRLVALQEGATIRYAESPNTVREAAPPEWMPPAVDGDAPRTDVDTWIGLRLINQDGAPVPYRPYRVVTPDGAVLNGQLDSNGLATIRHIKPGKCTVTCPFVEGAGDLTHVVVAGEHASGIAARAGFEDFSAVWQHGTNGDLRSLRPLPHVLAEGDELFVPDATVAPVSKPTGATHTFTIQQSPLKLRLKLLKPKWRPVEPAVWAIDGVSVMRDGDGVAELSVLDKLATSGTLVAGDTSSFLAIGYLTPIEEDTAGGWKARLFNIGFLSDPEDDDDELAFALSDFQAEYGLRVSGAFDAATKAKLLHVCGC
jgi:hypothetical protein